MKKKGFTLVELLAVIVILAIIALIATPMILNVIENAKKGASQSSALGYIDALEKGILEQELKGNNIVKTGVYKVSSLTFVNVKGDIPSDGWVSLNKGVVTDYSLKIGEYVINYDEINKKIITTKNGTLGTTPSDPIIPSDPTPPETAVCKRATTLHTEICTQTSSYCSGAGYTASGSKGTTTITYGNLGTTGTLTSGDAFDCDVNGDGTYDANTERFYYVSDLDSETAVLIYYSNVTGGEPNNTTTYAYNSSNVNNKGPVTAVKQLPTITQWKNVSLKNTSRQITNETGTTTTSAGDISTFDYTGYAARLLTYQEMKNGCNGAMITSGGVLDSCNYLIENTHYSNSSLTYGYWLETPRSSQSSYAWYVYGQTRNVNIHYTNNASYYGVRPAIEVLKSEISY